MSAERCLLKLRFLTLVMNTANLINERSTPSLGMSRAVLTPVAIFTTYIFMLVLTVGAFRDQFASVFLQTYALVVCSSLQTTMSIVVFKELQTSSADEKISATATLNGILPMLTICTLLADLVVVLFSNRRTTLPVLPASPQRPEPLQSPVDAPI